MVFRLGFRIIMYFRSRDACISWVVFNWDANSRFWFLRRFLEVSEIDLGVIRMVRWVILEGGV